MARFLSLAALFALWALVAALAHSRLLPEPWSVGATILADIRSGELPFQMACTLARVLAAFSVAFTLGVVAGYAMGRWKTVDRYADPWLIVLLNLPALVVIIFAYVWIGLNETARNRGGGAEQAAQRHRRHAGGCPIARYRSGRHVQGVQDEVAHPDSACRAAPACALSGRGIAIQPVDQLENRAGRRTDRTPQRRRVRSGVGVFAVRYDQDSKLCDLIRGTYARDRNPAGATA